LWIYLERFQYELEMAAIEGFDRHTLQFGTFARNDVHIPFGYAKRLRDHLDQLLVRSAVNGSRLQPDQKRAAARPGDAGLAGSRNDADRDLD
jgi:hypothetical protein